MGSIPAVRVISATLDGTTTTATTGSIGPFSADGISAISLHAEYNHDTSTAQTLVATAAYEASNDPRARQDHPDYSSSSWDTITTDIATAADIHPASGAGDGSNVIDNYRYEYLRITYTRSSGAGDVKLYFSGRSD